jgi:hypothetical protein
MIEATATVQWRMQVPEGYLLGCSQGSLETYLMLKSALLPPPKRRGNRLLGLLWRQRPT